MPRADWHDRAKEDTLARAERANWHAHASSALLWLREDRKGGSYVIFGGYLVFEVFFDSSFFSLSRTYATFLVEY